MSRSETIDKAQIEDPTSKIADGAKATVQAHARLAGAVLAALEAGWS